MKSHTDSDDMLHLSIKTPTSREEAMKLARLVLVHLDMIDCLIDDAVDRCQKGKQKSELKHAAHEWANLAALSAANRHGAWPKHKRLAENRDDAKKKFMDLVNAM